jgi:hypothetical protein
MLTSIATSEFVAPLGDILEVGTSIGKKLLAQRDLLGKPVCEVVSSPADIKKAKRIHLCKEAEPTVDADGWEESE